MTRGVKFAIYTPVAEIVDPETNESLGTYRERKATVEAQIVADKFTIAETPTKYAWNLDPLAALGESVSAQSKLPHLRGSVLTGEVYLFAALFSRDTYPGKT